MSNSDARVREIFEEAQRLFASKNAMYGDSWREQGWRGNVSRIMEKAKRVRNMLWRQSVLLNGSSEHPRETMMDMMNTLAFAIINMDDGIEWGHEPNTLPVPAPLENIPDWVRGPGFPQTSGDVPAGSLDGVWPADQQPQPRVGEATVQQHIPPPGEDNKPSPEPRKHMQEPTNGRRRTAQVTDRGSGPRSRPVKDAPQA